MDALKKTGPRTLKDRKEVGIELRKTHFSLGTDNKNYNSQYRQDYPEHQMSHLDGPKMDNVLLRRTHFKLGDYKNPYSTTTMDQNRNIENGRSRSIATLDQNVKNDLRKSHFILGNFEPSYNTMSRSEFYNKANIPGNAMTDAKAIEKSLRSHNYVLGNDKPDYKSETQAKYVTPTGVSKPNEHKISTQELQKSHYVFGNNQDPWATTTQMSYYPKDLEAKRFTKDLTRTNFVLGEDRPDFKSVHQDTFVPHQYSKSNEIKELSNDLRRHHFVFGNDGGDHMTTIQKQDFADPKLDNKKIQANKLDSFFLRASHFALGDKSQMPVDQYATTYGSTMKPQNAPPERQKENISFKSSININGDGPASYQTESRANFIPKTNNISDKEIKVMKNVINDIRGHHFALGEDRNDFGTTSGSTYLYDPHRAAGAKGSLDSELKNDLRATHYKLGYMQDNHHTTHQSSYVPMPINPAKFKDPHLRKSHIDLNSTNKNMFEGKTIYMSDFTKKELEI